MVQLTQDQIDQIEDIVRQTIREANSAGYTYDSITVRAKAESVRGRIENVL